MFPFLLSVLFAKQIEFFSISKQVGKIYFDSKKECKDDCYVGLPTSSPGKTCRFVLFRSVFTGSVFGSSAIYYCEECLLSE